MGRYVVQLLDLPEEQAADVVATARAQAEALRSAACADATKIRAAAVNLDDGRQPEAQRDHDNEA
jgi:hypothetical protein